MKCKLCGSYNDPTEWPEEDRSEYTPDLCHDCWILDKEDEEEEEPSDSSDLPDGDAQDDDDFDPDEPDAPESDTAEEDGGGDEQD